MKIKHNLALKSDLQYFLNEEDERKVKTSSYCLYFIFLSVENKK
jgi:hypothetical protein